VSLQVVKVDTEQLITQACAELEMPEMVKECLLLFERANDELPLLHSVSWRGRSAAAVYAIARRDSRVIPQKRVAQAFGVCEVTVRNVYRRIKVLVPN